MTPNHLIIGLGGTGGKFSQRGVQPATITGFGADIPVASNETEDGHQKNRRVEIWVRK